MNPLRLFPYLMYLVVPTLLVAQKAIEVKPFTEISLTGNMNVELKHGDKEEVVIKTEGIEVDDIGVKVNGGVLQINALKAFKNKDIEINITIFHKQLYAISAMAGAKIKSEDTFNAEKLDVDAGSGGKIWLDVICKSLKISSSSGADVILSGKTEFAQLSASTGGKIDGKKLEAERASVASSTGAKVWVKAISELDIHANSGGNVTYFGTPVKKTIKKVLAGEVENEY